MSMQIQCSGCQSKFKLKEAPAKTKKMKCPKCKDIITVKPPGEDELEEVATAPAKAKATRKAPAKGAGRAAAGTKRKATQKKKAKAAPADDWDLDGFDDDLGGGADDDFGDDGFEAPSPTRRRRSGGKTGKAPAKGKASKGKAKGKKGKKAEAKSGSKGKIVLFVILGLVVVGGTIVIVAFTGGDDDSTETASGDGSGESGTAAADTPDEGNANSAAQPAVADTPPADAAGQNVFDLRYIPANTDLLVRLKAAEVWNAPLLTGLIGQMPPGALDASPVKPEDFEVITVGVHIDPSMVAQQGQPPSQQIPPHIVVAKLTRAMSAQNLSMALGGSEEHNGQTLHQFQTGPGGPPEYIWFAESQLLVAGSRDAVIAAIDSKGRETRLERFDFADQSSQLVLAFATDDLSGFEAIQQQQLDQLQQLSLPGMDQLQGFMEVDTVGSGLGLNVYNDIRLSLQFACKDSAGASQLQGEIQKGITALVGQLEEQKKGNMMLGAIFDIGINIMKSSQPTVAGSTVSTVVSVSEDDIKAVQSNPLLAGMLKGMASQAGGMGGGPMGIGGPFGGGGTPFVEVEQTTIDFEADIQPIIRWRCRRCHVNESQGGFSLATYDALMAHSSAKGKAVEPGDPDASTFYTTISGGAPPHDLKETEADRIRAWIKAGAKPPGETTEVNALVSAPPVQRTAPTPPPGNNGFGGFGTGNTAGGSTLSYVKDVEPIMKRHCAKCHISRRQGNFSMASLQAFTAHSSGKNGQALTKGNASQSSLYTLIQSGRMPKNGGRLSSQEVDLVKRWIDGGANP